MILQALLTGVITSAITGSLILASLHRNPRIWIGDAPKELQDAAIPLSDPEKRQRLTWALPIIISMFGIIPAAAVWINRIADFSYIDGFLFLWIAWMVFNLFDLLIIDWMVVVWWHPAWTYPAELSHLQHINNYGFHFKAFLQGCVLLSISSAIVALIFLF